MVRGPSLHPPQTLDDLGHRLDLTLRKLIFTVLQDGLQRSDLTILAHCGEKRVTFDEKAKILKEE